MPSNATFLTQKMKRKVTILKGTSLQLLMRGGHLAHPALLAGHMCGVHEPRQSSNFVMLLLRKSTGNRRTVRCKQIGIELQIFYISCKRAFSSHPSHVYLVACEAFFAL